MGCQSSRRRIVVHSNRLKSDDLKVENDLPERPITSSARKQTRPTDDNDRLIDDLMQASPDDTFVDIQAADSKAFHRQFRRDRRAAIDNSAYRQMIESCRCDDLEKLVKFFRSTTQDKSKIECYWMIFYWIAINIEYDTVSYFSKQYGDQSPEAVFRSKRGVCAGYGNLFKHICDQLHLPCEMVGGYSKGYGFRSKLGSTTTSRPCLERCRNRRTLVSHRVNLGSWLHR